MVSADKKQVETVAGQFICFIPAGKPSDPTYKTLKRARNVSNNQNISKIMLTNGNRITVSMDPTRVTALKKLALEETLTADEFKRHVHDFEIMIKVVATLGFRLQFASDEIRDNKQIALAAIGSHPHNIKYASDNIQDNRSIVMVAVADAFVIPYISPRLQDSFRVIFAAMKVNKRAFHSASARLQKNKKLKAIVATL
jgi:hypothetical protein